MNTLIISTIAEAQNKFIAKSFKRPLFLYLGEFEFKQLEAYFDNWMVDKTSYCNSSIFSGMEVIEVKKERFLGFGC